MTITLPLWGGGSWWRRWRSHLSQLGLVTCLVPEQVHKVFHSTELLEVSLCETKINSQVIREDHPELWTTGDDPHHTISAHCYYKRNLKGILRFLLIIFKLWLFNSSSLPISVWSYLQFPSLINSLPSFRWGCLHEPLVDLYLVNCC